MWLCGYEDFGALPHRGAPPRYEGAGCPATKILVLSPMVVMRWYCYEDFRAPPRAPWLLRVGIATKIPGRSPRNGAQPHPPKKTHTNPSRTALATASFPQLTCSLS